eukprot:gene8165-8356_t
MGSIEPADLVPRPPSSGAADVATAAPASTVSDEFVNTGLLTWLDRRRQWTRKPADFKRAPKKRSYSPAVTPEQVLSFAPFPKPVPLEDVIEALMEVWEQEDFYS